MSIVGDFPFEFPRQPPRKGLAPPHPASGRAPDIMDILASAQAANPSLSPVELAMNLADKHSYGSFPGLQRTMLDQLAEAHTGALDTEAKVMPSLARMLMSDGGAPQASIEDILDMATEAPKLSSYFQGMTPTSNSPGMQAKVEEMLQRLGSLRGVQHDALGSTLMERMAKQAPVGSAEDTAVGGSGDGLDSIYALLHGLRTLARAGDDTNPERIGEHIQSIVNGMPEPYGSKLSPSVMEALRTANIGSETPVSGMDPASRRSLAPDMDPTGVATNMFEDAPEGQTPDIELLMKLMGMSRNDPRGGM